MRGCWHDGRSTNIAGRREKPPWRRRDCPADRSRTTATIKFAGPPISQSREAGHMPSLQARPAVLS